MKSRSDVSLVLEAANWMFCFHLSAAPGTLFHMAVKSAVAPGGFRTQLLRHPTCQREELRVAHFQPYDYHVGYRLIS